MGRQVAQPPFEEGAGKLPYGTAQHLVSWLSLAAQETGKCPYSEWPLPAPPLHLHLPFLRLALLWRAPTHPASTSAPYGSSLHITQVSSDSSQPRELRTYLQCRSLNSLSEC